MKLVGEIRNGAKHKLRALERMERKKSEAVEAPGDFIAHMVTKCRTNRDAARSSGRAQLHHGGEEGVVPLTYGSELAATLWRGPGWSAKGERRAGLGNWAAVAGPTGERSGGILGRKGKR